MIKALELKNWRTHKESVFDFGKGTNVIIGVMGSGKSSVMNALSYALFGNFPSLKSKQVSLNEIIMNKPNECSESETKIVFEKNEKTFLVHRIIKINGTNEAKLYENNTLIAGPKQKDVNEKVENILGLNYELFSRAAYSEQNEIDFFLKLTPSERKKKFDELLELEKYETARKNTISLKNQLTRENKQKKDFIEQQKETIKNYEEEKILLKINEEEKKFEELKNKKNNLEKIVEIKEKKMIELEKDEKIFNNTRDELTKLNSKIETLTDNLNKKEKIDIKKIFLEIEENKKRLILLKETEQILDKEEKDLDNESKKINEDLRVMNYRLKELEKEEFEIKSISGKCPKCSRELTEIHKKQILEKNEKIIVEIKTNIKTIIEKQKIINTKIIEKQKEFDLNKKNLDDVKEKILFLERNKKDAKDIEEIKKEIFSLKKIVPEKEDLIKNIKFDKKQFEEVKKDFFENKTNLKNIDENAKSILELIKSFEESIDRIKKIKNNISLIEQQYNKSEIATQKLGVFENCLIATQNDLRETMLETINMAMTQIWGSLYPYGDFVDAKINVIESGYDLQVLTRTGKWTRVEGILSGGERSAAAICIRIAFALVLTKQLSIFILDEPTHNLDKNAITKLGEMLKESLPNLVDQIFVITHEKEMEKAATSNIYLLQRNKDLDEATQIELIQTSY